MKKLVLALLLCSIVSIICLNKASSTKEAVNKNETTEQSKPDADQGIVSAEADEAEQQEEEAEDLSLSQEKENCPVCVLNKTMFGHFSKITNLYYNYISALFNAPVEAPTIADKIEKSFADLADYLSSFYGEASKSKLIELFKQQHEQFIELTQYVKEDNKQLEGKSISNISANAKTVASLIGSYNSKSEPTKIAGQFEQMYNLLLRVIENRVNGDWTNAINLQDDVVISAKELSDTLSSDIIDEYPTRFK